MLVLTVLALCLIGYGGTKDPESCVNKFCPMGTFCETRHIAHCPAPPCNPILECLPDLINGCKNKTCSGSEVCVEHTIPCIGRSCKKVAMCAKAGSCKNKTCSGSEVCVEHTIPCIGRSCKKVAMCAKAGTCEATVCPPSHKCKMEGGAPKCVKTILTNSDVADLSKFKDDH
uniref:Follistatin-like domain-containing protein n=1 Tax=Steinernema glaseri TaxID=37863 RepID=A0A1I7Z6N7_9BILA